MKFINYIKMLEGSLRKNKFTNGMELTPAYFRAIENYNILAMCFPEKHEDFVVFYADQKMPSVIPNPYIDHVSSDIVENAIRIGYESAINGHNLENVLYAYRKNGDITKIQCKNDKIPKDENEEVVSEESKGVDLVDENSKERYFVLDGGVFGEVLGGGNGAISLSELSDITQYAAELAQESGQNGEFWLYRTKENSYHVIPNMEQDVIKNLNVVAACSLKDAMKKIEK